MKHRSRLSRIVQETRAVVQLGMPLVIHNLALMGMQFTDTLMAGRLSPRDLAAVAIGGNIWGPISLFNMGVFMAINPIAAHLFGSGRLKNIGHYVRQAFWLSQGIGWLSLLLLHGTSNFLSAIAIPSEIIPLSDQYLKAISWGMPAFCLYNVFRFASEGVSHTRPMLFISLLGLVVNGLADYTLMYGLLGFPRLGAVGCGWASALVQWIMLGAILAYARWIPQYRPLEIFSRWEAPLRSIQWEVIRLGVPIGISIFVEGGLFAAVALIMGMLGTVIVAGHQIAVNFAGLTFMVPLGLSMAISVRVGQARGRGEEAAARFAGFTGIGICVGFMAASALIMTLFPAAIASLYTNDPSVRTIAVRLLAMAAVFQLSDGLQVGGAGALRGLKDTRIPMIMTIVAYWVMGFPLAYLLGLQLRLGPQWVWVGLIGGLSTAAILLNTHFARISRPGFGIAGTK